MEIETVEETVIGNVETNENAEVKLTEKLDKEEYAYLKNTGFSSEIFKIELKNLPKHYGYGEIKKLVSKTLDIDCHKIKLPRKNSSFGFLCFKNNEGEFVYIFNCSTF